MTPWKQESQDLEDQMRKFRKADPTLWILFIAIMIASILSVISFVRILWPDLLSFQMPWQASVSETTEVPHTPR